MERRAFLASVASGLVALAGAGNAVAGRLDTRELWISARGSDAQSAGVAWIGAGEPSTVRSAPSGFRGHAALQHPTQGQRVLLVARRPGTEVLEVDLSTGVSKQAFRCAEGSHLYGHACFSADGRYLFTTEADIASGAGRIFVRDTAGYAIIDEWSSHGVGPHEIRLMPDQQTLVVANGGLQTHPASGRQLLNPDTMQSNLSYLSMNNGDLLEQVSVPEAKSSIRHMDIDHRGAVAFGVQFQRAPSGHTRTVALTGVHRRGQAVKMFDAPGAVLDQLRDYVGSVAVHSDAGIAGFTSPRGNLVLFWNIHSGNYLGHHALRDVCGIAVSSVRDGFVISNSFGEIRELDARSLRERRECRMTLPDYRWDNHLLVTTI